MIPLIKSNPKFNKVVVSTGDILNLNNKPGRSSNEELIDGLKLTLCCKEIDAVELNDTNGQILRASQELGEKITENERSNISIGAKIFLNKNSSTSIREAMAALLGILKVEQVDNVVLAYHRKTDVQPTTNGDSYGILKWSSKNEESIADLKQLWESLEYYAKLKQISQLGISDLDIDTLTQLYEASSVHPSIAQVNLASCCVVPSELKEFCNKHEIQLLTHSDPEVLLEDEQFSVPDYAVDWIVRYQVHVRCRGVLTAKGYIVGATNKLPRLTATEMTEEKTA